jgi:hypothetical protein
MDRSLLRKRGLGVERFAAPEDAVVAGPVPVSSRVYATAASRPNPPSTLLSRQRVLQPSIGVRRFIDGAFEFGELVRDLAEAAVMMIFLGRQ